MKIVHESIFSHSIRSFFAAFFTMLGILAGLFVILLFCMAIFMASDEEENFTSSIKIVADDKGNTKFLGHDVPVILQITLNGEIGSESLNAEKIQKMLSDSRSDDDLKNDRVKALFLIFNSPGGGVHDSDNIYRQILEYKKNYSLPVYAYVDGICASGGYYISCAADKIYTSPISLIGSIGVLAWPPFFNLTDVMKKVGVEALTLYAGKGKDEMNPLRPWKEGEQDNYQNLLNFYYNAFVDIVSQNRSKLTKEKLTSEYGARVYPAPEAKEFGYVDDIVETRHQALRALAEKAGIQDKYQVITYQKTSWWKKFIETNSFIQEGKVIHHHQINGENNLSNPFAYIFR